MSDLISRQQAIDVLDVGKELLSCALDNMDIVGNDREKFEWGLGLIESYIDDIKDIPSVQSERAVKDCRNCEYGRYNDHYCTYFCYCTDECKDWDKWKPSAHPERKTGEWIRNDNGTYSCSVCQSWIPEEQHCYARYCLYCGADMRGESE